MLFVKYTVAAHFTLFIIRLHLLVRVHQLDVNNIQVCTTKFMLNNLDASIHMYAVKEEHVQLPHHLLDHQYAFTSDCYDYNEVKHEINVDYNRLEHGENCEPEKNYIKQEIRSPSPRSDSGPTKKIEAIYIKEEWCSLSPSRPAPNYECVICHKPFVSSNNLRLHVHYTHKRTRAFYHCDICNKQVFCNDGAAHVLTHKKIKDTNVCDICHKRFASKSCLRVHMHRHTGEKPFECGICHKRFIQKGQLKTHMRTHTGEKAYVCEICQKRFNQKSSLTLHMPTHTKEKPYECDICHRPSV